MQAEGFFYHSLNVLSTTLMLALIPLLFLIAARVKGREKLPSEIYASFFLVELLIFTIWLVMTSPFFVLAQYGYVINTGTFLTSPPWIVHGIVYILMVIIWLLAPRFARKYYGSEYDFLRKYLNKEEDTIEKEEEE